MLEQELKRRGFNLYRLERKIQMSTPLEMFYSYGPEEELKPVTKTKPLNDPNMARENLVNVWGILQRHILQSSQSRHCRIPVEEAREILTNIEEILQECPGCHEPFSKCKCNLPY